MENFNLGSMISKFIISYKTVKPVSGGGVSPSNTSASAQTSSGASQTSFTSSASADVQMGALSGGDRSVYIKDLMKLPKNLNELMFMLQKNINQVRFNRLFEQQQQGKTFFPRRRHKFWRSFRGFRLPKFSLCSKTR